MTDCFMCRCWNDAPYTTYYLHSHRESIELCSFTLLPRECDFVDVEAGDAAESRLLTLEARSEDVDRGLAVRADSQRKLGR